jgi:hypothetical protein
MSFHNSIVLDIVRYYPNIHVVSSILNVSINLLVNPQGSIQKSPLTYAFLVSYHSSPLLVKIQYYPYITIIYYPNNTHIISYYPSILYIHCIIYYPYIYIHTYYLLPCAVIYYPCYIHVISPIFQRKIHNSQVQPKECDRLKTLLAEALGASSFAIRCQDRLWTLNGETTYINQKNLLEGTSGFSTKSGGLIRFT